MNFGSVIVRALIILVLLFLLSLVGALTFPVLALITSGTGAGISSILLFVLAILLLSLIGSLIARGIKSVKESMQALLLVFVGSFFMGAILAIFALLNIPYAIRVNLNWLGTSWYSPLLTLLFIGLPLMIVFLYSENDAYTALSRYVTPNRIPFFRYPLVRTATTRIPPPRRTSVNSESINIIGINHSASIIHLRIVEQPLTAINFNNILSAFTELHTKSWMISNNRLADLVEYIQTHDLIFAEEAGLIVEKIKHNSPPDIKFILGLSPKNIAEALKIGIDAVTQAPLRIEETKLENQAKY